MPRPHAPVVDTPGSSSFDADDVVRLVVLSLMWGGSFLFIKVVVEHVAPIWLVAGRVTVGCLVLLAILAFQRKRLPTDAVFWGDLAIIGVVTNALPWLLLAHAGRSIPSGLSAVLNAAVPAATLAFAGLVGVERLTRVRVTGLAIATLGTAIAVSGERGSQARLVGALAVVGAALLYAAGAVYAKRRVAGHDATVLATGQMVTCVAASVPVALLTEPMPAWSDLPWTVVGSWLALGSLGSGIAFILFYRLMQRVGATNASMVTYLVPVIGLIAGWAVLGERIGWNVVAGAVAIVAGIYLAQRHRAGSDLNAPPVDDLVEVGAT